jgi:predicted enzyme related to lactoylglutathione lyase
VSVAGSKVRDMTETHHAISYIEINTHDLAAAKAFYAAAFGWEFSDYGDDYAGIRNADGEGEIGGLNPTGKSGPGGALVLLYSDDLDATLASVEAAGGKVVEGPYDYPGGRRFHFTDPSGNELGVFAH